VSFLIISLIKKGRPEELLAKCNPMGKFPKMRSVLTFENSENGLLDLCRTVLVDTPIGNYFEEYFCSNVTSDNLAEDIHRAFSEQEISVITNTIKKLWLEDFYRYTHAHSNTHTPKCTHQHNTHTQANTTHSP